MYALRKIILNCIKKITFKMIKIKHVITESNYYEAVLLGLKYPDANKLGILLLLACKNYVASKNIKTLYIIKY